ncbi:MULTISPECIES: SDR family NAD(P)-dependent oxidoreductase [Streptomyces albidoflavus group]|uniref:SDR family NAD(P)-dependent oxidoreductase n=1 Tax=Streptomyces albidoflavus group TaxID=1477431 RepID=UPI0008F538AD|nr:MULTISPECIES: SDR family oxidoreductase [Streptomyces albidoflavus group]
MTTTQVADDNPGRVNHDALPAVNPELVGRTVVVTGAGRGMGALFLEELARRGVNGVGGDLDQEEMASVAEQINARLAGTSGAGRVVGVGADVTDPAAGDALVATALREFGRLDLWVNNAGVFPQAAFTDITPQQLALTYGVNVNGVVYGGQAAARHFRTVGGGAIVNMSSVAAVRARPTRATYNSSKAAVRHLTTCMAVELGPDNIRVNSIAPGYIDTEMTRWIREDQAAMDRALTTVPLRRIGAPMEVFAALYFLLSDSARYITGVSIPVDGGSQHV